MAETIARWPRLLSEPAAAEYLSLSTTTLRTLDLKVRRIGRRVLYDIKDLDLYVDRMDQREIADDLPRTPEEEERLFFEGLKKQHA